MFHDLELTNQQAETLAEMGSNAIAYMREMTAEELQSAFPETPELEKGQAYWALFGADGTPLMLASDRAELASSAFYNNLKAVMPN